MLAEQPRQTRAFSYAGEGDVKQWVTGGTYVKSRHSVTEFDVDELYTMEKSFTKRASTTRVASQRSSIIGKPKGPSPYTTHFYAPKDVLYEKVIDNSGVSKVAIIGGGVAGIVTARVFLDEGLEVTLFECTNQLAGVWAENYVGFGIQVPSALYEFPDEPLPEGWDFCAGTMIGNYINQYAHKHGVSDIAQLNTRVTNITPEGEGYRLSLNHEGIEDEESFDLVVVATGVYGKQDKFVPDWPGKDKFKGPIIHAADYLNLDVAKKKHVISVGYGKSAFDCAQISAKVASSSMLLFREAHWCVPRQILGLVPFEYATFSRFGAACLKPSYARPGPFETVLHSIPGFLSGFWWLVGTIFKTQFWLPRQCVPDKGFIADFWGGHGILPHPQFFKLVNRGEINAKQGEIKELKESSAVLMSGEEVPCDVIVAATGYKPVRSFLPKEISELRERDGLWLYRNMIHPDHPRLVFLGSEVTTFTNITTPSIQARWLVEMLAGRHDLPSKEGMQDQIAAMQRWKRANMPNAGPARSYMIQTHQVHYYDELLTDMGANIRRKQGSTPFTRAIKEIFDPYRPGDYRDIVTGEFKYRKGQSVKPSQRQRNFAKEGLCFLVFAGGLHWAVKAFMRGAAESLPPVPGSKQELLDALAKLVSSARSALPALPAN